jgi:hypothetical protein
MGGSQFSLHEVIQAGPAPNLTLARIDV